MTSRRTRTMIVAGLLGIAATTGVVVFTRGRGGQGRTEPAMSETKADPNAPLKTLAEGVRRGDAASLNALAERLDAKVEGTAQPLSDDEAATWVEVIASLRAGYLQYPAASGRTLVVGSAAHILGKFTVEPAPSCWLKSLVPLRDLLTSGLSDRSPEVRVTALMSIGKLWNWYPARTMIPTEEQTLGEWKDFFHGLAVRQLADRDPRIRAAAVACLSQTPIDSLAAPAVAYVDDSQSGDVRHQVLVSFARRSNLLTEDMIIKRLHDPEPGIPQVAELILGTRGLTKDQISLGRMISSPRADMRASVIPLLKEREDLDHVVWLLRLSHDPEEIVRAKAVEAMTGKDSAELRARVREMATKDASEVVRIAASKLVAKFGPESTASLPPLPGSPSLTPRAN
jgi:hypothetical protein